ncbi:MAG TPA: hypothetical protein VF043_03280 [Ktedonobacteraceae bacterium]
MEDENQAANETNGGDISEKMVIEQQIISSGIHLEMLFDLLSAWGGSTEK